MSRSVSERPALSEDLHLALLFGALGAIAIVLLLPYLLATLPLVFEKSPSTLSVIALAQAGQGFVLLSLLSFVGLRMGHTLGLGSPWLRAWRFGRPRAAQAWRRAIILGLACGLLIVVVSPVFDVAMPAPIHPLPPGSAGTAAWKGFLASFYGGIAEEVMLRLFLMTLVLWLCSKLSRTTPPPALFWFAIVLAALAFGAGHLPAAAKIWNLDSVVITRTLVLNGIGGLVFGWLYWRQGLESAMLGHFSADLVLHVAAPLFAVSLT